MNAAQASVKWFARALIAFALLSPGCATTQPPMILVPQQRTVIYQQGTPICLVESDSVTVLLSVDYVTLFDVLYSRAWLLYFNRATHPVLIDPLREVSLVYSGQPSGPPRVSIPTLPYKLQAEAERQRQIALIASSIGAGLQTMGASVQTQNTTATTTGHITGPGGESANISATTTLNDAPEKAAARAEQIAAAHEARSADISHAYTVFMESVNSGILRKHTVFPGQGVHGYLYLPLKLVGKTAYYYNGKPAGVGSPTWALDTVRPTIVLALPMVRDSIIFGSETGD